MLQIELLSDKGKGKIASVILHMYATIRKNHPQFSVLSLELKKKLELSFDGRTDTLQSDE